MPCDKDFGYVTLTGGLTLERYGDLCQLTCITMSETTPKDPLIILCEFLVGNKAHSMSSSVRAQVNCSRVRINCSPVNVKLHLSCTVLVLNLPAPNCTTFMIPMVPCFMQSWLSCGYCRSTANDCTHLISIRPMLDQHHHQFLVDSILWFSVSLLCFLSELCFLLQDTLLWVALAMRKVWHVNVQMCFSK